MSKKAKPPVDRAEATIKKSTRTDALKVSVTNEVGQAMPQSPSWGAATDVQAAVKVWTANGAALSANTTVISGLRAQRRRRRGRKQRGLRRGWVAAKGQVTSTVTVFCGGSADMVSTFNLDVVSRGRLGALPTPTDVAVNPGVAPGEVVTSWEKGIAAHGFLVQHAADPTNPATVSVPAASTKSKLTLGGLPQGANVSFRVAAIDPASATGQTPWSAWVVGNAR